jgi:UDP-N-acetylmuramate--alanine ligase
MSIGNTHYGARRIGEMLAGCESLFFIGIGGISMSALAMLSAHEGYAVGGSDRTESRLTRELQEQGIAVYLGHDARHVAAYDAVIYTVAIGEENPEYRAAMDRGLPLISRADYLGYLLSRFHTRVGIAGMHGKSTCTAMCTEIFLEAADPTVFCGAELPSLGGMPCRIGQAREHAVFEACEYMDSFLDFDPTVAVVLNIGMDHVDYFHSMEQIYDSFNRFAKKTGTDGVLIRNADDAHSRIAFADYTGRQVSFGVESDADFTARDIVFDQAGTRFDFCHHGEVLCRIELHVSGLHNVTDALAAATAAYLCGLSTDAIVRGLAAFSGAKRRMERKGTLPSGAMVYDDYGHHPDEIRATLAGARRMGYQRILCAYQPHTFSRTAGLLDEFSAAFGDADRVFFVDVYAAREENIYGVTSKTLADRVGASATYCGSFEATAEAIAREARDGDLVIVMGAGDVFRVFPLLGLG